MTIANMMAEFGAKNCYLPPDDAVFETLADGIGRRRGGTPSGAGVRAAIERELRDGALYPDPDASYEASHDVDASELAPQVACPHTVDRTVDVDELDGVTVDQAFLGTCTNGRLEDLEVVHSILRGRRLATGTRFLIVPASKRVFRDALAAGIVDDLLEAGAVFSTPGCGPCMGNHQGVLAPGEVCISSANRNFQGRMGTREAEIYLASPAVVAASAVAGRIVSPREVLS